MLPIVSGVYSWQVRTEGGGIEADHGAWHAFTVSTAALFSKQAPGNGATGLGSTVTLQWGAVPDEGYAVCWDTTNNDTCDGAWWPNGGATARVLEGLSAGTYYWQVRTAGNAVLADNGAWHHFTVAGEPVATWTAGPSGGGAPGLASAEHRATGSAYAAGVAGAASLALAVLLAGPRRRRRAVAAGAIVLVLAPAAALAQTTTQVVEYYTTDAVGSVRAVTRKVGTSWQVTRHDFMPFGEEVSPQNPPQDKRLFTGKERDVETGMDYFEARHLRATFGRFTAADLPLADARPCDPQSWGLYVYGRNNPLRYIDPTGRCVKQSDATKQTAPNDICQDSKNLKADEKTAAHIKGTETFGGSPNLKVYSDTGGLPTVGYGHRVTPQDNLKDGDTISAEAASTLFESDFLHAQNTVRDGVQGIELSQNEFNALTDLVYSVGPGVLGAAMSPSLNAAIKAGDYEKMSEQLKYTLDAKGVSREGLAKRSDLRKSIFLGTHKW
jgi:RHS repeat-associated protein